DGAKVAMTVYPPITSDVAPGHSSVVLRDLSASPPSTRTVSRPPGGEPFVNVGGDAADVAISPDGRYAAFVTEALGLGAPPLGEFAVVVRDLATGATTLASREDGPDGAPLEGVASAVQVSRGGRRVAFVMSDPSLFTRHLYVRDLAAGRT